MGVIESIKLDLSVLHCMRSHCHTDCTTDHIHLSIDYPQYQGGLDYPVDMVRVKCKDPMV